jgi:hypothetical protein
MAYTINKTNGNPITVADNVVDSTYSVQLVGKNRTNYGATINQNFFRLMEHFSSGSAPSSPQSGQVWFDSTYSTLKVWDGAYWKPLSGIATATPSSPVSGDLWFDTVNQQLKVYAGSIWVAINSGIAGGGTNGAITETVIDSSTVSHYVSSLYASGVRVAMLSKEPVTGITGFTGFSNLVAGINYNTSISTSTVNGNVVGATAVFSGNITAGNINAVSGILSVTGNANVGNIGTGIGIFTGAISVTGNANVGNVGAVAGVFTGAISVTGNANVGNVGAVAGVFTGAISVTGNANVGNIGATSIVGALTTASQTNITSVGTLGSLSVTGNANVGNVGAVAGVFTGSLALKAPVTVSASTYTMLATDSSLIINASATCTVTLLAPATYPGRILNIKTTAAYTVVSAGSNVVPVAGGSAGTAILAGTAGKWAMLQSDGTSWVTMLAG